MAVVLLLVIVLVSYLVVRVGALGLELTGVDRERANFQALSAFTNSGYTTRESEDMVRHPVRRRIISVLMIFGHAGMVGLIGTFAKSLMDATVARTGLTIGVVVAGMLALLWLARRLGLTRRVHDLVQRWLAARYDFTGPSTEEMLRVGQGYGVSRITLLPESPVAGRYLRELDLKPRLVQILGIERGGKFVPIPTGEDRLEAGDVLIVYGGERAVSRVFHPDATGPLKAV